MPGLEPPDPGLARCLDELVALAVAALERRVAVELEPPAADPLAGSGIDRAGADDPGRAPRAGPQNAPGKARGEHLERGGGHHRGVRVLSPEQPPVLVGDRDTPFTASSPAGLPEPGLDRLLDPGGVRRQGRSSRRSRASALRGGGAGHRERGDSIATLAVIQTCLAAAAREAAPAAALIARWGDAALLGAQVKSLAEFGELGPLLGCGAIEPPL